MNRAYCTLDVRSVDDDAREITGIASTPAPDRYNDVIEPRGARFALPLPLLLQHDHHTPIGQVVQAEPTDGGIRIVAKLAAAGVDAAIDRAWNLIREGLIRGLSIGFIPLEQEPLDAKRPHEGYRISSWDWMELSAVTIPANAEASIINVRHYAAETAMTDTAPAATAPQGKLTPLGNVRHLAPAILKNTKRPYSLVRAIAHAAGVEGVDAGLEREYAQEAERRQPWRSFKGLAVPLGAVMNTKATHTTGDASGAPLTFEDRRMELFTEVPNALRIATAAGKAGVRFLDTNEEKLSYPVQTQNLNLAWHAKDSPAGDAGQGQFALREITPKYAGLKFDIERSALKYAIHPDVESLLIADARQAVAAGIDDAIINGAGTATEPQGIFRHPDIAAAAGIGATPTVGGLQMIVNAIDRFDQGEQMRWLMHPNTVAAMMDMPRWPNAENALIDTTTGGELAGREYRTSHKVPRRAVNDADLAIGNFSEVLAVTFGGMLDLHVNPYSQPHFERGAVLVVGLLDFNTAVRDASKIRIFTDAPTL